MKHSNAKGQRHAELLVFPPRLDPTTLRSLWSVFREWFRGSRVRVYPRIRFECNCLKKRR